MSAVGRWFGRIFGGEPSSDPPVRRRAGYDLARTGRTNKKHWADADNLDAVSQLTPEVRRRLRMRSRHEVLNNCYAAGVVRTLVADTVGMGPRLQMLTDDAGLNRSVEDLWRLWSTMVDWPLTCRVLCGVEIVAGEAFAVFRDSKKLDRMGFPVTLDLRLIEPDQVADPWGGLLPFDPRGDDGVEVDEEGDVVAYRILKVHPGNNRNFLHASPLDADRVDARNVIHWYQPQRPNQLRGATQLAPGLPIMAQLRRFTQATLTAAEVAAMLAGVLELAEGTLPLPNSDDEEDQLTALDMVPLVEGMLLTVPGGGKVSQFKPEQPTTNYDMFVAAKLRELGRAINMPFGKVAGDHSRYNFSSGRMDDAPYWHDRDIARGALEAKAFDRTFWKWCDFAKFSIPGLVRHEGRWWELRHRWQYDARPVTDPVKDATADELNLTNASDSLAAIAARDGVTEEELILARRRTKELFEGHGLPLPPWLAGQSVPQRTTNGNPVNEEGTRASA